MRGLAALLTAVVWLAAPRARAEEVVVTDTTTRWNRELVGNGLAMFGLSYGAGVAGALVSGHPADDRLFVPVVGPWLDLMDRGSCVEGEPLCAPGGGGRMFLIIDGVVQAGGVIAIVAGLVARKKTHVTRTVQVMPMSLGRATPGVAVFGRF